MVETAGLSVGGAGVVVFTGVVGVVGFVIVDVVVVVEVEGLIGVGPFANPAHLRPQYGWTLVPSLNFGFTLQCYENQIR